MRKFVAFLLFLSVLFSLGGCTRRETPTAVTPEPMVQTEPTPAPTPTPTAEATPEPTPAPTPEPTPEPMAVELTAGLKLRETQYGYTNYLSDGNRESYMNFYQGTVLTVESEEPMAGLYLTWWTPPVPYTLSGEGWELKAGENEFLHEFVVLPTGSNRVELHFAGTSQLCEVRAFTAGQTPEDVQRWLPPCEQADLLLLPCHADDDVIFFGAMAAAYIARGYTVQVAYLVHHYDWQPRPQELLDAMYALGMRHYPVIGPFPDHFVLPTGNNAALLETSKATFGEADVIRYYTRLLRRFKPLVIAGHDTEGEYGHGAHLLNAYALPIAVGYAADRSYDPETVEMYGTWDVPKFYRHMDGENEIWLDVETPLDYFGGRSAFQVAQEAMLLHESQLQYAHRPMLEVTIPADATKEEREELEKFQRYDCRRFGLVRSTVGADTGNDIMEHTEGVRSLGLLMG